MHPVHQELELGVERRGGGLYLLLDLLVVQPRDYHDDLCESVDALLQRIALEEPQRDLEAKQLHSLLAHLALRVGRICCSVRVVLDLDQDKLHDLHHLQQRVPRQRVEFSRLQTRDEGTNGVDQLWEVERQELGGQMVLDVVEQA